MNKSAKIEVGIRNWEKGIDHAFSLLDDYCNHAIDTMS